MAYYNRKKKNGGLPIWVICVGVLSAYFALIEGKVVQVTTPSTGAVENDL